MQQSRRIRQQRLVPELWLILTVVTLGPAAPTRAVPPSTAPTPAPRLLARWGAGGAKLVDFSLDGTKLLLTFERERQMRWRDGKPSGSVGIDEVAAWDFRTSKRPDRPIELEEVLCAKFVSNDEQIFVHTLTEVHICNARTGRSSPALPKYKDVWTASASPDARFVALGVDVAEEPARWEVEVFGGASGKVLRRLAHSRPVEYALFSPDGSRILTLAGKELAVTHVCRIWDVESGNEAIPEIESDFDGFAFPRSGLLPAAFSADGKRFALADRHGFSVFDAQTSSKLFECTPTFQDRFDHTTEQVRYTSDGKRIVCVRGDCHVSVWDASTGKQITQERPLLDPSRPPDPPPLPGVPNRDGTRFISPEGVWDTASGRQIWSFGSGNACVAISRDGRTAATGNPSRGETVIWDISE